jgi:hypothetical protein
LDFSLAPKAADASGTNEGGPQVNREGRQAMENRHACRFINQKSPEVI